jgi:hypothetical protein
VTTRCGPVSVVVYGDEDKPALVTYPDVGLNCMCFNISLGDYWEAYYVDLSLPCLLVLLWQTCPASRYYSFARKQRPCCSTIFASTILPRKGTRSVMSVSSFMRHAQARVVLAPYMIFIVEFVKNLTVGSGSYSVRCAGTIC